MRDVRSASSLLRSSCVLAVVSLVGCGDDDVPTPVLRFGSPEVIIEARTEPFQLVIRDGDGREVLRSATADGAYGGVAAKVDEPYFIAQSLPGWDGYDEGDAPWLPTTAATVVSSGPSEATFALEGGGARATLAVRVDGARVHLSVQAAAPADANMASLAFVSPAAERFYGMGERFATLGHRGWSLYSYAEEGSLGLGEDAPVAIDNPNPSGPSMTYFPVPFFLSSGGYGVHLETTYRSEIHFASERADAWRASVNAPAFEATVYVQRDPLATIGAYLADTGYPMIPAPWVFGPRRRVGNGSTVEGVPEIQAMRDADLAITGVDDAVHFLPALSHLGREEELAQWTEDAHAAGYKAMAYNNPYVAKGKESSAADFAFGEEQGYFVRLASGEIAITEFISGELLELATIDLTNPDAVAWFQALLKRTLDLGYDGWMHDFGEYIPRDALAFDGRRGDELHNAFPVLSAKAAHDLMEKEKPGDYLFFVRSGGSGTQRWVPAVWCGDAEASFDETQGLPSAVRGGLNLSMTGVPYWGSDVTGFKCLGAGPFDKEIFLRWVAFGAASPIMMEQNACANPIADPEKWKLWNDAETVDVYRKHARLHTRLAPYFWALAKVAHETGRPITLHPFLLHPEAAGALDVDDAYYLGPSLYAAPVVRRGQTDKTVWLPPGQWVDIEDYTAFSGDAVATIPAPLAKLPLLLRAGAMVPMLDASIDTLAPATDPDVVDVDDVADRLDVVVALGPGDEARFELADGTVLEARRVPADAGNPGALVEVSDEEVQACSGCFAASAEGDVDRLRISSEIASQSALALADVEVHQAGGPARRVRWDVLRLR